MTAKERLVSWLHAPVDRPKRPKISLLRVRNRPGAIPPNMPATGGTTQRRNPAVARPICSPSAVAAHPAVVAAHPAAVAAHATGVPAHATGVAAHATGVAAHATAMAAHATAMAAHAAVGPLPYCGWSPRARRDIQVFEKPVLSAAADTLSLKTFEPFQTDRQRVKSTRLLDSRSYSAAMTEQWTRWENEVVNGVFPLRRAVNFSDHSAVFLTEHKELNLPYALLKLVPAIPTLKEAQLAQWATAATLTHPHLIRLHDTGRCQLGGLEFLFVVMEYAEQTLATLLSQRGLPPSTLRKALRPILASLSFLHGNQLVHGGLKPSNILLAHRQLKLASDTVRPSGESAASIAGVSPYDPPEVRDGSFSTAGDIWSLGILMVEALTRRRPTWPGKHSDAVILPALPPPFADMVRQCLKRDPTKRPTIEEIGRQVDPERHIELGSTATATSVQLPILLPPKPVEATEPRAAEERHITAEEPRVAVEELHIAAELLRVVAETPGESTALLPLPKRGSLVPAGATILLLLIVVWAGLRWPDSQAYSRFVDPVPAGSDTALPRMTADTALSPRPQSATLPPPQSTVLPPTPATALPPTQPTELPPTPATGLPPTQPTEIPPTPARRLPPIQPAALPPTLTATLLSRTPTTALSPVESGQATTTSSTLSTAPSSLSTAPSSLPTVSSTLPSASADNTAAAAGSAEIQPAVGSSFVLHEEAPEVAPGALKTIRGHIKFAVRVRVDGEGNVEHVSLASRSPSQYFKRLAFESARKWKFVAADGEDFRQWLLWFDFTRHGITIEAPPHDSGPQVSNR
jgi:serine/threonine protein kinase